MSTNNVESEIKITFLIKFKSGNKIFTGIYPSTEDLTIQYSDGVFIVAQNTFETITIF